jgi:hypothetical protein
MRKPIKYARVDPTDFHSNLTECATDGTLLCSQQLSGALIKNYLGWHLFEMPTGVGLTAMQSSGRARHLPPRPLDVLGDQH